MARVRPEIYIPIHIAKILAIELTRRLATLAIIIFKFFISQK